MTAIISLSERVANYGRLLLFYKLFDFTFFIIGIMDNTLILPCLTHCGKREEGEQYPCKSNHSIALVGKTRTNQKHLREF
jgi:hypothetical protein